MQHINSLERAEAKAIAADLRYTRALETNRSTFHVDVCHANRVHSWAILDAIIDAQMARIK